MVKWESDGTQRTGCLWWRCTYEDMVVDGWCWVYSEKPSRSAIERGRSSTLNMESYTYITVKWYTFLCSTQSDAHWPFSSRWSICYQHQTRTFLFTFLVPTPASRPTMWDLCVILLWISRNYFFFSCKLWARINTPKAAQQRPIESQATRVVPPKIDSTSTIPGMYIHRRIHTHKHRTNRFYIWNIKLSYAWAELTHSVPV